MRKLAVPIYESAFQSIKVLFLFHLSQCSNLRNSAVYEYNSPKCLSIWASVSALNSIGAAAAASTGAEESVVEDAALR